MRKTLFFLLGTVLLSFHYDNDLLKKIALQLEKYYQEYPEEKVYLDTDKPYYIAGEIIWFKAYLVEALTNTPDTVSIPLYIDLIDNMAGRLIDRRIIKLENGFAYGDFSLPDSILPGVYRLRVYTNWMRNFKEDLFYTKDLMVYSSVHPKNAGPINEDEFDLQFFPEGGNLIEELNTRVAFKATNAKGKGIDITGSLLSSSNDTVLNFKTEHLGMGFFRFKPQANKSYRAIIQYHGFRKTISFPEIRKQGFLMTIDNTTSKSHIRLALSNNLPEADMLLVGQSRGVVFYAGRVPAGTKNAAVNILKDKFPVGVAQFTIFDETLKPHCERVIFIPPTKELFIHLSTNKKEYKPREKTTVSIQVKDHEGKPVEGNFSLAALDENQINGIAEDETILTNLLLSSDLKGHIENPSYYFNKINPVAVYHLDILMMTQGWRRFTWDFIMQEELPATKFLLERGLIISGEAMRSNGKPFDKPVNLSLMIGKDSTQQFLMGTTEKNGSFLFYGLDFKDSTDVMAQLMLEDKNIKSTLTLTTPSFPAIKFEPPAPGIVDPGYEKISSYITSVKKVLDFEQQLKTENEYLLKEVKVESKKIKKEVTEARVLYSNADAVIKGDESPSALNIFDLIRGRVAGVMIRGDRNNPSVSIRGQSSVSLDSGPLYLIDGTPVTKETALSVNINMVERVEVVKSASGAIMYGDQARGGIISVFTKTGSIQLSSLDQDGKGPIVKQFLGYYTSREFYVPKYNIDLPQEVYTDRRSTVFWSPVIKTDKEGKASIHYLNTDAETTVRIGLEGLTYTGIPGVATATYQVKN